MEILLVVAVLFLLAAIVLPNSVRASTTTRKSACINNLRQIDAATQQWALELVKPQDSTLTLADISPYLHSSAVCPAGGKTIFDSYALTTVGEKPACLKAPATHSLQ